MIDTIETRTAGVAAVRPDLASAAHAPRVLVVTGGDDHQMPLMRQMLASLRALPGKDALQVACLDLGLSEAHRRELAALRVDTVAPVHRFQVPGGPWPAWLDAYLAQPFLPETLPGWDVYLWIDADIWFQDAEGIDAAVAGALDTGLAIAHERTPMYRPQLWLTGWMAKHFVLGQGVLPGLWLATRPHLNSGFYAARAGTPFWSAWTGAFARAIARSGSPTPHGQFSINRLVYGSLPGAARLPATLLECRANWIVDRGPPMWDDAAGCFCEPAAPHRRISTVHLAGPGKSAVYEVRRTGGGRFATRILPGASPERPALDPAPGTA